MSKKKKPNNKIIRFNTTRHDARVIGTKEQEEAALKQSILERVHRAYNQKKYALLHKRKTTTADVNRFLYDLENIIHANCTLESLREWKEFTIAMLEAKVAAVIATDLVKRNMFTPYRPTFAAPANFKSEISDLKSTPRACIFETAEQLAQIPEIQLVAKRAGFVGLLTDGLMLMAAFDDGDLVKVGAIVNAVALEKVPTLAAFQKALPNQSNN